MKDQGQVMVFDVDGTLVDSNDAHALAWVETLRQFGIKAEVRVVRRLIGMGGDKLLPTVTGIAADSDRGKQIAKQRSAYFRQTYMERIRPFAGTRALFTALRNRDVRLAVASSSDEDDLARLLDIAEVADLIERRASADDAERSKPDPDIIHAALARLGKVDREKVSMVGDTPYDVEAARKAGVRPIAFRCGGWSGLELTGAVLTFDGPADMLARLDLALIS
ncbi:MAG TPA: HAD family hydrolase [Polyangia bacterium]|jgi:HAD superfamily hydrolase (TIGR01549 family)